MDNYSDYRGLSPTDYAVALKREQFMHMGIRELWPQIPRIAGPAVTVQLAAGDNLMLHAAIYEAPAGSVIVVDAQGTDYAVAGGNVCAVAQKRGIAGFVIDGVVRDRAEIRQLGFPVFARGVIPIPGVKQAVSPLNQTILCGGVVVSALDVIVADEEGIAVIPDANQQHVYAQAKAAADTEAAQSLDEWQRLHQSKIDTLLKK